MRRLLFSKLSGAGNDFIIIEDVDRGELDAAWLAERLCARALSIGADRLILIRPVAPDAVGVRFFNSDGSAADLCGNGSRCAARLAVERGLVTSHRFRLVTDAGELEVEVHPGGPVEVAMPCAEQVIVDHFSDDLAGRQVSVHSLRLGVPHAVVFVDDVEGIDEPELIAFGRRVRHNARFPEGANVNVVSLVEGRLRQRTYERGVEGLTKACGTGSTASAVIAHQVHQLAWPITVTVDGGQLTVDQRDGRLWRIGDARLVASGVVEPEAVNW